MSPPSTSELNWHRVLLAALAAISPAVYAYIQGYWAVLLVPLAKWIGIEGKLQWEILLGLLTVSGVIIVATLLAFPLGYVTKNRAGSFGGLLSLAPLTFLLWTVLKDGWTGSTFLGIIRVTEYVSIVIAFIALARLGAHFRRTREAGA